MGSGRFADTPSPARRRQATGSLSLPPADPPGSARDMLLRSWAGRLFLTAVAIKLIIAGLRRLAPVPAVVDVFGTAASIAIVVVLLYFLFGLFLLIKRRLLWRVRRKLILSYIFIGVVPALLIVGFFLLGASVVSMNVSAYVFKDGFDDVQRSATLLSEAAAAEIGRLPGTARDAIERVHRNGSRSLNYPALSMAFLPEDPGGAPVLAGEWRHVPPPERVPAWIRARAGTVAETVAVPDPELPERAELVARAVTPAVRPGGTRIGYVVTDLPIDGPLIDRLQEVTGVRAGSMEIGATDTHPAALAGTAHRDADPEQFLPFGRSLAFFDTVDWDSGAVRRVTISLTYRLSELYRRVSQAQSAQMGPMSLADAILAMLVGVAVLFLIIQMAALAMGLALARSITSSIHELFMGTERVRLGDFAHRIDIRTRDQLGELAGSFNQMTGSIENLLQTAAEKKRLEEELRIARQIQMSLLPRGPLEMPGLAVAALCVPAREVGGDYYDFFILGEEKVGILVADVSGKGTSAALYMAELKGLLLSLSEIHHSPRQLLLEVNRIISENLDSRSFITMTYAVIDVAASTLTYARAGHTPLIYLPGPASVNGGAQVLAPSGLVLGLRIEGASQKFDELLEEEQIQLQPGGIIVLYTDGITEAMNASDDLFGESRLSRIVEEHAHLDSGELRERILREIEAFVGAADQHDDMTMILVKIEHAAAARVAV